jgi:hypothetical protein
LSSGDLRERLAHNAACLVAEKYEWIQIGADFRDAIERLF